MAQRGCGGELEPLPGNINALHPMGTRYSQDWLGIYVF